MRTSAVQEFTGENKGWVNSNSLWGMHGAAMTISNFVNTDKLPRNLGVGGEGEKEKNE